MWAARIYKAIRVIQPVAQATAAATGAAGAAGAAVTLSQAIEEAREKASLKEKETVDTCSTCSDPKCDETSRKIKERIHGRKGLKKRYDDMLEDTKGLYENNFERDNPLYENGVKIGSWKGHQIAYAQDQRNLGNLLNKYYEMGCSNLGSDEADEALEWARRPSPQRPRPTRPLFKGNRRVR